MEKGFTWKSNLKQGIELQKKKMDSMKKQRSLFPLIN